MKQSESKLKHLPVGSCKVGDLDTAALKRAYPQMQMSDEIRRQRIRNRKKLLAAFTPRTVGEALLRDSFSRAKGV